MNLFNLMNWIALICLVASVFSLALIQLKRSHWWGPSRSIFEDLSLGDKKLLKISGVLFILSVVFFITGAVLS
jgi:hypothetical protein